MVDEIHIQVWAKQGDMLVRTEALKHDNPLHPYNQAIAQGAIPENFGLIHPLAEKYAGWSRSALLAHIAKLEEELEYRDAFR